jgi:hypothetical protein
MKALPVGISTLKTIIEEDMVYIDKTDSIYEMIKVRGRYFLSRPRRFGKSLLVDTLKEIFEANRTLFAGLYIHEKWDWNRSYPVIKIDFSSGVVRSRRELDTRITHILRMNADRLGVDPDWQTDIPGILENLVTSIVRKYESPAVILVDEYDKPLLDNIENTETAVAIREGLKNFYSPIKALDGMLQFVFLTGVTKFGKVNIFSGINNLSDITLEESYATICGYTQGDLENSFYSHLEGVDWDELQAWYNGYSFVGEPVYNPYDILLFIQKNKSFRNYWFETGTPSFLIRLFTQNRYFLPELDTIEVGEESLSSFEIEALEPVTLLFQSGYLTIKSQRVAMKRLLYTLGFPNREVRTAFNDHLVAGYTGLTYGKVRYEMGVYEALSQNDMPALEHAITRLFAGIPWSNFTHNRLSHFEGYYASVLYALFAATGCETIPEDVSNRGQVDLTVKLGDSIFVTEIKEVAAAPPPDTVNPALEQIHSMEYAKKYSGSPGNRVFEIGLLFGTEERNLVGFAWNEVS